MTRPEADRPMLTYRDDATGERTELTAAELGSWVARTATLLRDGCGLRAGDEVAIMLPPHWQTAIILLGAWSVGLRVSYRPWATAGLASTRDASTVDAVFVARQRLDSWLETVPVAPHRFVLGLLPQGRALDEVPDGYREYLAEVRRYPDPVPAYWAVPPEAPASPEGTSFGEWAGMAHELARRLGLKAGDQIRVDVADDGQPVSWLLAPLAAGASILICANTAPEPVARVAVE